MFKNSLEFIICMAKPRFIEKLNKSVFQYATDEGPLEIWEEDTYPNRGYFPAGTKIKCTALYTKEYNGQTSWHLRQKGGTVTVVAQGVAIPVAKANIEGATPQPIPQPNYQAAVQAQPQPQPQAQPQPTQQPTSDQPRQKTAKPIHLCPEQIQLALWEKTESGPHLGHIENAMMYANTYDLGKKKLVQMHNLNVKLGQLSQEIKGLKAVISALAHAVSRELPATLSSDTEILPQAETDEMEALYQNEEEFDHEAALEAMDAEGN